MLRLLLHAGRVLPELNESPRAGVRAKHGLQHTMAFCCLTRSHRRRGIGFQPISSHVAEHRSQNPIGNTHLIRICRKPFT
jgi:hypothetical protein